MTTTYELYTPTDDDEVGGGLMALTTEAAVAQRWQANGGTVRTQTFGSLTPATPK